MKFGLNDEVAVVKTHKDTGTTFIVLRGTLEVDGRGIATTDKRALAQEGEVKDDASLVDAKGWVLVRDADGKRFSYHSRNVKLFSQKLQQKHDATMQEVERLDKAKGQDTKMVEAVFAACAELGLETSSLTYRNAVRVLELTGTVVHPLQDLSASKSSESAEEQDADASDNDEVSAAPAAEPRRAAASA